jgi:UDP-3-O-[3-hydroxymyristoyl] N-acetylglucosamine deacetylase
MEFARQTLRSDARFDGLGLHSGEPVTVTVHPSKEGIAFRFGSLRVAATPDEVTVTARRTQLGSISTVEHLMAAFAGLGVTDAEVELSAPELPAADGSARPFVEGIQAAGMEEIGRRKVHGPFSRLYVRESDAKISIAEGAGHWRYKFTSPGHWPFEQTAEVQDVAAEFVEKVAPARTWCFEEEVERMRSHGLGRGLGWGSVVIVGTSGFVNEARSPDEPARHKLLDLIGDLYLSGVPPSHLSVAAVHSGHRSHVAAARLLREAVRFEDA